MLKNWIEDIKRNEEYRADLWRSHATGSVLELSIQPPNDRLREHYRIAVIHIGRVLQALIHKAEAEGYSHHIQSFPNLEDARIVAAIRLNDDLQKKDDSESDLRGSINSNQGLIHELQRIAESLNLSFRKSDLDHPEFAGNFENVGELRYFILSSKIDNPFTWLKTGYWQEMACQYRSLSDMDEARLLQICSPLKSANRTFENGTPGKSYIQIVAGLKPETV